MDRIEKARQGGRVSTSNHLKAPVTKLNRDYIKCFRAGTKFDRLLFLLDGVKELPSKNHARSATALCPAHPDKKPSLCADLTHDGRILLYCRAGCGGVEITAAVGLSAADLYPDNNFQRPPGYPQKEIDYSLTVAQVAEKYRRNGRKPKPTDLDLINQALKVLLFTKKQILQGVRDGI